MSGRGGEKAEQQKINKNRIECVLVSVQLLKVFVESFYRRVSGSMNAFESFEARVENEKKGKKFIALPGSLDAMGFWVN